MRCPCNDWLYGSIYANGAYIKKLKLKLKIKIKIKNGLYAGLEFQYTLTGRMYELNEACSDS